MDLVWKYGGNREYVSLAGMEKRFGITVCTGSIW